MSENLTEPNPEPSEVPVGMHKGFEGFDFEPPEPDPNAVLPPFPKED